MNLKSRQDYMDTNYTKGVKDASGRLVMRPLTSEEKDWLAQFYKEWLNADKRNSSLYTEDEEWKAIYNENNARNRCLYNQAKKTGKLTGYHFDISDRKLIKELGEHDLELMLIHDRELYKKEDKE